MTEGGREGRGDRGRKIEGDRTRGDGGRERGDGGKER